MPKVVRVEHPNNNTGPYHSGYMPPDENDRLFDEHCDERHPGMWRIFGEEQYEPGIDERWVCGCITLDSLRLWFSGFWPAILASGHQIVEYDVPNSACLLHDFGQVAFVIEDATERKVLESHETLVPA